MNVRDSVVVSTVRNVYSWLSFGIVGNSVCRMWESCSLYGFQRYHIGKGGYGFFNCFFLCVFECKHDNFTDKSHLLSRSLSVKTELKQGSDKTLFYAVLGISVDMPVFNGGRFGFACCNAVKPRPRLPVRRWSPVQSFHRAKGSDSPCESTSISLCRSCKVLRI